MKEEGIHIETLPELQKPILIVGFDGWGNALNISTGMVAYLIRKFKAGSFARLNPDLFYRYDQTRPIVNIENGRLKDLSIPGGVFYAAKPGSEGRDLLILKAEEPNLRWQYFAEEVFSLCERLGVEYVITLGSMIDNVLHSDRIVSGFGSSEALLEKLRQKNVSLISYHGPSAIHSTLHSEGKKRGFQCISLWCHCPYYLQGATHFGMMSHLGSLLSYFGEFELETEELEEKWKELEEEIHKVIETHPQVQALVKELRKAKVRGSWEKMKNSAKQNGKIINLQDFLEPK
ncbi:MAG: PAC2 family protein [Deltaproteobacteria bacterium]|nr:PAC2 family protein [Deltaproteobacteria bacterium]